MRTESVNSMHRLTARSLCLCATLAACHSVQEPRNELIAGWGVAQVFDEDRIDGFSLEYRHAPLLLNLSPMVGYSKAAGGGASLVYLGANYPLDLGEHWRLSPSFGVGYFDGGGGLELGGELQFRSGLELNRRLDEHWRVGAALTHVSNGNLYDFNPGTEALIVSLHYGF